MDNIAYTTGQIFALLNANKELKDTEHNMVDINPAKMFAQVMRTRKLTKEQDQIMEDLIGKIDNLPETLTAEQKSQFWLGWNHFPKIRGK